MASCIREGNDGILIDVVVVPNSKRDQIVYTDNQSRIKVRVRAKAEREDANNRVIEMFSRLFGCCGIISGRHSKKKTLLVRKAKFGLDDVIEKMRCGG